MTPTQIHKEDVKAALRKKYGSVEAAQAALGFTGTQLRDLLRGRTSRQVHAAVAKELGVDPAHLVITTGVVHKSGDKNHKQRAGRSLRRRAHAGRSAAA